MTHLTSLGLVSFCVSVSLSGFFLYLWCNGQSIHCTAQTLGARNVFPIFSSPAPRSCELFSSLSFFHRSPSGRVFLLFFVKRFTCLLKGSHQLC
uniref:Putative secreted protein n=1 Tax=Rhipicephalus microplus TaxID=6941 RepID=A0A6G5A335_RHIMP